MRSPLSNRLRRLAGTPDPSRDLLFIDAFCISAAVSFAYAARAATNDTFTLTTTGVLPYVREALPATILAFVLAAAMLGLYGERGPGARFREHAAAVAYATAALALTGTYFATAYPPTLILVPGFVAAIAAVHLARTTYWRRWHDAEAQGTLSR